MSSGTLSGSYTNGITLSASGGMIAGGSGGSYDFDPLYVTGAITSSGISTIRSAGNAIYAAGQAWTVINSGSLYGGRYGVNLYEGGALTNLSGGLIQGDVGVNAQNGVATISNAGEIISNGSIASAVSMNEGTLTNTGTIFCPNIALVTDSGAVTIINYGLITGGEAFAMDGGTLTNMPTGTISGSFGEAVSQPKAVVNYGLIAGGSGFDDHAVTAGLYVTNLGTGLIQAYSGIYIFGAGPDIVTNSGTVMATGSRGYGMRLAGGGTVIDSGVINGGTAVVFLAYGIRVGTTASDVLALEAGYSLSGVVIGSTRVGASNTLEVSGALGPVSASYNGLGLTNFQDVLFGPAGSETLAVSNTSGTLPVTVSGLTLSSEAVDLTAIGTNGSIVGQSTAAVTVGGSLGTVTLPLDATDNPFLRTQSDGNMGTELVACFRRGTRIATDRGPVAVEALQAGDRVVAASGRIAPVGWLGWRRIDCRQHRRPREVWPVRIRAHAFGPGAPHRDPFLSPDHAVLADGTLVPVRHLVNGRTIVQEPAAEVTYYHLELAAHDVILAEGLACESYLDTGNRAAFAGGGETCRLRRRRI